MYHQLTGKRILPHWTGHLPPLPERLASCGSWAKAASSRTAMSTKWGLFSASVAQHSSTTVFNASGTTFPHLGSPTLAPVSVRISGVMSPIWANCTKFEFKSKKKKKKKKMPIAQKGGEIGKRPNEPSGLYISKPYNSSPAYGPSSDPEGIKQAAAHIGVAFLTPFTLSPAL
jgi:hypothetical protein